MRGNPGTPKTHGATTLGVADRTWRTYRSWCHMMSRCNYPRHNRYYRYGGRGIQVCERWRKFENFFADMGLRPTGAQIDRIDNNGNYEPANCRWATSKEQGRNRSDVRKVTYLGETRCLSEWCELLGLEYSRTKWRVRRGWLPEVAFTKAPRSHHRKAA